MGIQGCWNWSKETLTLFFHHVSPFHSAEGTLFLYNSCKSSSNEKTCFPEANIVEYSCPSQVKSIIFPLFYNIPCPIVTLHPFCCLSRASQKMVKGGHCFHCEYMISCFVSAQTRLLSGVSQNSAALQIVPFQSQTIHLVPFKVAFGVVQYCKKKAKDGNSDSVKSVLSPQGHQGTEIDLDLKRKGRVKMATPALV